MFDFFSEYNVADKPDWVEPGRHIYVIEPPEHTGMLSDKIFLNRILSVSENTRTFTYRFDAGFPVFEASFDDIEKTVFEVRCEAEDALKRLKKTKANKK